MSVRHAAILLILAIFLIFPQALGKNLNFTLEEYNAYPSYPSQGQVDVPCKMFDAVPLNVTDPKNIYAA